ncbi:WASH complex subunit 2 isoform 3-T3 [Menidia menidia]
MSAFPEGMANGPSRAAYLDKDAQIWERPWSLEEIRQHSASWSLAADSGLFLFLQDFSQRMLSKTHEIEKQLDSLICDTKATDSRLQSVFNDFLMLSNTQFIENRVYDEEVEETAPKAEALEKQPEQEKTREQKESELIPKMQEAVNYGLKVLESAFEHLDIKAGNSDSEDEEATDRVEAILEPKDLYVDRPLPYLIGSQAFMEQDDVGLGDLSSDEMSVDSDRDSVIESEDDKEAHSDEDFDQEEEEVHNNNKKKSSMISYEEDEEDEEDDDSDIFGESDRDDDVQKNTGSSSFADELAARIKGDPVSRPEGDRASLTSKKKSKGRKDPKPARPPAEEDSDDMFKPPRMDDDDFSPFGGKSGLFSGGRGLFDDDDEGDLFSEAPKPVMEEKRNLNDGIKTPAATESNKPEKKIFPDNSLFSSGHESDSAESKENGTLSVKGSTAPKQVHIGAIGSGVGSGLFDDEDEEDDFFSGKSLKKTDSVAPEKPKPKRAIDLFDDEEDEDGDIFSAPPVTQSKRVEERDKPPEKKVPPGAISMFGPGTKSLLNEALKKRQPSTSSESEKSEENGLAADVGKAAGEQTQKHDSRGLFSDDEDAQLFSTIPKSQSKPEPTSLGKTSKAPLSLFDDEEEDLFASAAKSKPKANQAKSSTPQPSNVVSSSLFSDDEDQWMSSKSSTTKSDAKTEGMTTSTSAPSSLPSTKASQQSSLFDEDDDDLFAPTTESSQKKPQRVALLFEDEGGDEDKGFLFGTKPAVTASPEAPAEKPLVTCQTPTLSEDFDKPPEQPRPVEKKTSPLTTQEGTVGKKKPAGAVSLFGGIDVLASKQSKSLQDEAAVHDDSLFSKESPPPLVKQVEKKEEKNKTSTVSLFDEEEEDESDWSDPIFRPTKPEERKTLKPVEERPQAKSTGVFQDEELLFSQTQQKDNDPDVDLFASSEKATNSKLSPVQPAAQSLFADDDEDDLFSPIQPKPTPPKVAEKPTKTLDRAPLASPEPLSEIQKPAPSPVKPKDSSSRIGKIQASLMINPAALLPGAVPSTSEGTSSSSGVSSSSLSPSPATTPVGAHTDSERGVSFDTPVKVTTLQSAHMRRAKGSVLRRPQSRAARHQAAQRSMEDKEETLGVPELNPSVPGSAVPQTEKSGQKHMNPTLPNIEDLPTLSPSQHLASQISPRPSELILPVPANTGQNDISKNGGTKLLKPSDEDDLFGSDMLFGANSVASKPPARETTKTSHPQASGGSAGKKDKDKSTLPSIFNDTADDLFQSVKQRTITKKAKASSFLEEDDDDDIFRLSNSSTPSSTSSKDIKSSSSFSKQDIFQDEVANVPKVHKKHKEKSIDASLFDDNIDIFADLTDTFKPKQKSKTKGETKSIFDDDMDDIFSASTVKPAAKTPHKSKKTAPPQESSTAADSSNIFDDPLNALGGI